MDGFDLVETSSLENDINLTYLLNHKNVSEIEMVKLQVPSEKIHESCDEKYQNSWYITLL